MRCVLGYALMEVVKGKKEADGANSWKSIIRLSLKPKLFLEPQLTFMHPLWRCPSRASGSLKVIHSFKVSRQCSNLV